MQKVMIIGATSGIGRGLAERFLQAGCKVGITGRRENLLQEISSGYPDRCFYRVGDITQTNDLPDMLNGLCSEVGGMDLLIISSGTGELNPALDYSLEEPTLFTNVVGFTCVADWGYRYFENQGNGHLVVISSLAGLRGEGVAPAYNASKAFQINYTEGLRKKAVKSGRPIYVTDIRPGFVDTAMAKGEGLFWVAPLEKAVGQIYQAIGKRKKVVYVSRRWRYVAWVVKRLPLWLYSKI